MLESYYMDEGINDIKQAPFGKWIKVFIVIIIVGWAVAGFFFFRYRNVSKSANSPNPLASYSQSVNYPLYYPADTYIELSSRNLTNNIVTYAIKYKDDEMFASIQPLPHGFDFNNFVRQVTGQTSIRTPVGKAVMGELNGKLIGSITTDKAWFLLSTSPDTPVSDMQSVLLKLKS